MNNPEEKLKGGDYSNYLVRIDNHVSYSLNILNRRGMIDEDNKIDSKDLIELLEGLSILMKLTNNIHILMKEDEILINDINLEFYRKYIQLDVENQQVIIHYEFTY